MDIATKGQKAPVKQLPDVDFDTRLALASAGMDAILAHKHGVTLAEAARALKVAEEADLLPSRQFKPNRTLAEAGYLIRRKGWTRNTFENHDGAMCAMGAIRGACYGPGWQHMPTDGREHNAIEELMNRIAADTGEMFSIPQWNDTRPDVSHVLRLLY